MREAHSQKLAQLTSVKTGRASSLWTRVTMVTVPGGEFWASEPVAIAEQAAQDDSVERVDPLGTIFLTRAGELARLSGRHHAASFAGCAPANSGPR